MGPQLSLDIETLSLRRNAVVVSIGCVSFDIETRSIAWPGTARMWKLDIGKQVRDGRHVSRNTVDWWCGQSKRARLDSFGSSLDAPRRPVGLTIQELIEHIALHDGVWCKGPAFDGAIIEDLLTQWGFDHLWNERRLFRRWRDVRTLAEMPAIGGVVAKLRAQFNGHKLIDHNPVADAVTQAAEVVARYPVPQAGLLELEPGGVLEDGSPLALVPRVGFGWDAVGDDVLGAPAHV